jgi:hypothetical protein
MTPADQAMRRLRVALRKSQPAGPPALVQLNRRNCGRSQPLIAIAAAEDRLGVALDGLDASNRCRQESG